MIIGIVYKEKVVLSDLFVRDENWLVMMKCWKKINIFIYDFEWKFDFIKVY